MAETIESFVAKLQAEGVQAGREAAEKLEREARAQAEGIVKKAEEDAEKILAGARAKAKETLDRAGTDLELAARDAVLKLRETLSASLQTILDAPVAEQLTDTAFLKQIIHDVAVEFAKFERRAGEALKVNVTPEAQKKLADWVIKELRRAIQDDGIKVDLKGKLKQAGIEYTLGGATIEVTQESVVETLGALVSASLRDVLGKAMARKG